MDVFDSYFKRADLDQDGKISGAEAVAFFQRSNLPKEVLAQIWAYANQNQIDYLGRPEFYNALRLITVAQSGRELTPDIVKTALGPAAAQIPAPKINHVSVPSASGHVNSIATPTQSNSMMPLTQQMGAAGPSSLQNLGVRGHQAIPNMSMSRPTLPSLDNNLRRPPQGMPTVASLPMQGVGQGPSGGSSAFGSNFAVTNRPNLSTDWLGGRTSGTTAGPNSQSPNRGIAPINQDGAGLGQRGMNPGATPKPQAPAPSSSVQPPVNQVLPLSQPSANVSRPLTTSGNGSPSYSVFGGDIFSAMPRAKPDSSTPSFSAVSLPMSSNMSSGFQNPTKTGLPDSLHGSMSLPHGGSQQSQSQAKQIQLGTPQSTLTLVSNVSVGPLTPPSSDSQLPWPKITQSDIQKYTKVFVEVDSDRDGKITGEQARNLFLSWRLPRDVLMQVWDLSDQDNDSMLSLREFCTALYLLERYREGRPLPTVLPNSLGFDEALPLSTDQPSSAYGGSAWQRNPGLPHQGVPGPRPVMHHSVMKPPRAPLPPVPEEMGLPQQQKAKVPLLEKNLVNQLSQEEQKSINSKFQEATEADKKVKELEKEILESREKNELYRTKMQELVLYKSRCDNRLNEITERVESLARKYEDKYKQVGDVASKLTLDEATFRDIQERKLELYNAIVKMEQGGTADGVLQDRVNKIQSDLEELVKTLNERCKQYGLRAKPASLVELPFGWQPGIQEGAADWDEDWDKFNEEGYVIIKELTVEVENIVAKPKLLLVRSDRTSAPEVSTLPPSTNDENKNKTGKGEVSTVLSSSEDENKSETGKGEVITDSSSSNEKKKIETEKPSDNGEHATDDESAYAHSEDGSGRSPHGTHRSTVESSSPEFQSRQFGMHDLSPHAKENQSDHGGAESTLSGDRHSNEPSWGAKFDIDDADSMWGLSTINTKLTDPDKAQHDSFFGTGDFGLNPIRTGTPSAESVSGTERKSPFFDSVPSTPQYKSPFLDSVPSTPQYKSPFLDSVPSTPQYKSPFFDSVPSTPQYNSLFSPRFSEGPEDHAFDRFSRFDSFSMNDGGLFPPHESFSRFDSMRSTTDPPSLARFDSMRNTTDAPSIGGLSRFDSMNNKAEPPPFGSLARFDSIGGTSDYGGGFLSFDDADPFGSTGPFKSSEGQTPNRSDDSWSAF